MAEATRITLLDRVSTTKTGNSWEEFAQVYDRMILDWLGQQNVQPADAEDIRQEVMTTVFQEIGQFEHNGRPGAFRNWLRKITCNRLHRLWQKRKRSKTQGPGPNLSQLADQLDDQSSSLTRGWEAEHNRYVLEHLLNELGEEFRDDHVEAFRRIALKEEPAQQVADGLGMTLGAARVAKHRVLKALKEIGQGIID